MRRSPHGERGLKFRYGDSSRYRTPSLSSWRAWIEMLGNTHTATQQDRSLSSWRAWIEIRWRCYRFQGNWSLSSWRAWIEISMIFNWVTLTWSLSSWRAWIEIFTAIGIGSNTLRSLSSWRAWIEIRPFDRPVDGRRSLSSWRAWIEIRMIKSADGICSVALLMESVD